MNLAHDTTNMHKRDSSGEKKGFGRGEEGIRTRKEGIEGAFHLPFVRRNAGLRPCTSRDGSAVTKMAAAGTEESSIGRDERWQHKSKERQPILGERNGNNSGNPNACPRFCSWPGGLGWLELAHTNGQRGRNAGCIAEDAARMRFW
jgi:hypothetical protein